MKKMTQILYEVELLTHIKRNAASSFKDSHLGKTIDHEEHYRGAPNYHKIGSIGDHHVYHSRIGGYDSKGKATHHIVVAHKDTHHVDMSMHASGYSPKHKVMKIESLVSTGAGPKAHDVYHNLLKSGHTHAIVGHAQTPGSQKVWRNLAKHHEIEMHGWHHGKPVNLNPFDKNDTHSTAKDAATDHHDRRVMKTKLVASLKSGVKHA